MSAQVAEQLDTIRKLQLCESELHKQQDRVQRIREERERMCEEARKLRDENYRLMHDLTRLSEDKNCALMCNRDLQLEVISQSSRKPCQKHVWVIVHHKRNKKLNAFAVKTVIVTVNFITLVPSARYQ